MMNPKPQAFDPLALRYDNDFTYTQIGQILRSRVHARLETYFRAGDHVLELGCGTGEDALYLAERGVNVIATDTSEKMLVAARGKVGENPLIKVEYLDLQSVGATRRVAPTTLLDGVFSNFGPLNCLSDWKPLAAWLAEQVKPGGVVMLGVMSPFCVWEIIWHGVHGDFKVATRRLRKNTIFQPEDSVISITVSYPTIRRMTRDFSPYFECIHLESLGLFLPPSDVFAVIEKRPRLLKLLLTFENAFARIPPLALFADHYWIEFRRLE
ncbi:MAG: class I SAM-dependent methyltransferase [Chitinophagaceae bacterium]|nr:class I SAM-dependent methyltransferase [Anaerolineae bacterium]